MSQQYPVSKKTTLGTNPLFSEADQATTEAKRFLRDELDIDSLEVWVRRLNDMDKFGQFDIR